MCVLSREVYDVLVKDGTIVPKAERNPPTVPMDYSWAQVSEHSTVTVLPVGNCRMLSSVLS